MPARLSSPNDPTLLETRSRSSDVTGVSSRITSWSGKRASGSRPRSSTTSSSRPWWSRRLTARLICGGSAWKSRSSSAGSASVRPLFDRLSSCIALAILRHQPLVLDSYPHSGANLQGELPDHQGLGGDHLETLALEQLDADFIVVAEAAPDRPRLALGDVGQPSLNHAGPQLPRFGGRQQPER